MNIGQLIETTFPNVPWTGSSRIHRSLRGWVEIVGSEGDFHAKVTSVCKTQLGGILWGFITEKFSAFNWLINEDQFKDILLTDVARHLHEMGDTQHPQKLKNPKTQNVFHRLSVKDSMVGGLRVWLQKNHDSNDLHVCFRFRIEEKLPDEVVKTRAQLSVKDAEKQKIELEESMKIAEPAQSTVKKARAKVRTSWMPHNPY